MITLLTRNNVNLPTGSNPYGPFARPANLVGFQILMGRATTATPNNWPNAATTAKVSIECSYDGGLTWDPAKNEAGPQAGGIITNRNGEIAQWDVGFRFDPLPTHIRGDVVVTNGPLRTSLIVNAVEAT